MLVATVRRAADHFHAEVARDALGCRILRPDQRDHARQMQRAERIIAARERTFGGEAVPPIWLMNQVPDFAFVRAVDVLPDQTHLADGVAAFTLLCQPQA